MPDLNSLELLGKDILLRKLTLDDVTPTYVSWLNDSEVNCFLETRHHQQTLDNVHSFVSSALHNKQALLLAIIDKETQLHIGNIKLDINPNHKLGTISLFIGNKAFWYKGYAVQAISLISDYGLKIKNLQKLSASAYSQNLGSIKAFEKSGYHIEAELPNHYLIGDKPDSVIWLAQYK